MAILLYMARPIESKLYIRLRRSVLPNLKSSCPFFLHFQFFQFETLVKMAVSISVRESTIVKPAEETPRQLLWMSNLDMTSINAHTPTVYIYKPKDGADNFFDPSVLKDALSKALVPFYPLAGRLQRNNDDKNGRIEINCNAEGVLFVVADSTSCADDFTDLKTCLKLGKCLIPAVDYSTGISSYPLFVVQVTYLKCGGVALGIGFEHNTADGFAALDFVKAWSEMARGVDLAIPPTLDRTLLRARDPPQPLPNNNHHVEYRPQAPVTKPAAVASDPGDDTATVSVFNFTREHINLLKANCLPEKDADNGDNSSVKYTSYEVFAAHVWRSACKARQLADDEVSHLRTATNGRSRLQPPLPPRYFGNVIFSCVVTARAGDLMSKPLSYAVSCIHKALLRMDDEYLRSALDYLELQKSQTHLSSLTRGSSYYKSPNLGITSWVTLPIYDADFGWGRPVFMGRAGLSLEGKAYMVPSASGDGSFSLAISLQSRHMDSFSKLIYDI
uniref:shikimate O-hydroxycinnamoyltransferase-like n=1 Tax=Fragaria vesca subsp. vesca TaxID=101020 RepID=UPI0005C8B67E|nr:PREDICTED: shikimate O-hydroxycinnamoyltransferase-like [Fragaria vesca subsp. vesca]